jgi:hypothetical protein
MVTILLNKNFLIIINTVLFYLCDLFNLLDVFLLSSSQKVLKGAKTFARNLWSC